MNGPPIHPSASISSHAFFAIIAALLILPGGPLTLLDRPALAQCEAKWFPGGPLPGINGAVRAATTWDPDGPGPKAALLVVGGEFTVAGGVVDKNVAAGDGYTDQGDLGAMLQAYGVPCPA